jgi:hypothetical protein
MSSIEVLRTHMTAMATASRFAVSSFMGTPLKSENHDGSSMVFLASSNHQACVGLLGDEPQDGHRAKAIGRRPMRKNGRGTGTLGLFLRAFKFTLSRYWNE